MKRSEMVEELKILLDTLPKNASNEHIADVILARVERLGMKPPYNWTYEYFVWEKEQEDVND